MPRTRNPYPADFRDQIIALARAGRSVESLAREFEPCAGTIAVTIKRIGTMRYALYGLENCLACRGDPGRETDAEILRPGRLKRLGGGVRRSAGGTVGGAGSGGARASAGYD